VSGGTVVFLGPSAPLAAARAILPLAEFRPPVRHGDIWRTLTAAPRAIGVIDGLFEQQPAVWHKELLEALGAGVHVFGSASMGALRAAELHAFGMRGVGRVFEAFRDGVFEDDDEVALVHGPAEAGYVALSEPMANVRFTMDAAVRAGAIGPEPAALVVSAAKAIFYPERSWAAIDRAAIAAGADPATIAALATWRRSGAVDQKRDDALAMLREMAAFLATDPPRFDAPYAYQRTSLAEAARRIALEQGA
jgi:hypothetical protein